MSAKAVLTVVLLAALTTATLLAVEPEAAPPAAAPAASDKPADLAAPSAAPADAPKPVAGAELTSGTLVKLQLRDGQLIVAPLVKQNNEAVYIDLDQQVLVVSRDRILNLERADETPEPSESAGIKQSEHLFQTGSMPVRSVKELAEQLGEGVVMVRTPSGTGSGFITDARGYVVTNCHVIEGETRISLLINRKIGEKFERTTLDNVQIVAINPFFDLALLKFTPPEGMNVIVTTMADDEKTPLRDGDAVFAIGAPLGLERTVSQGIVSKMNRNESGMTYIQTTTQINPGNSGGPLFNNRGQVVGVTNMKVMFGEGLGFAIPGRYVKDFLRNRDAFAYDPESPNSGFIYLQPGERVERAKPAFLQPKQ